jgi:hypothetical protein
MRVTRGPFGLAIMRSIVAVQTPSRFAARALVITTGKVCLRRLRRRWRGQNAVKAAHDAGRSQRRDAAASGQIGLVGVVAAESRTPGARVAKAPLAEITFYRDVNMSVRHCQGKNERGRLGRLKTRCLLHAILPF